MHYKKLQRTTRIRAGWSGLLPRICPIKQPVTKTKVFYVYPDEAVVQLMKFAVPETQAELESE